MKKNLPSLICEVQSEAMGIRRVSKRELRRKCGKLAKSFLSLLDLWEEAYDLEHAGNNAKVMAAVHQFFFDALRPLLPGTIGDDSDEAVDWDDLCNQVHLMRGCLLLLNKGHGDLDTQSMVYAMSGTLIGACQELKAKGYLARNYEPPQAPLEPKRLVHHPSHKDPLRVYDGSKT